MTQNLILDKNVKPDSLLSEYLRPRNIKDLTLVDKIKDKLLKMQTERNIPHMLFYGAPGIGKTTAAELIADRDYFEVNIFDMSINNSIEFVRDTVLECATAISLFRKKRLIILDEADGMTEKAQSALKAILEKYSDFVRFIFITNKLEKITDTIRSRAIEICFDQPPSGYDDLVKAHIKTTIEKLQLKHNSLSESQINEIEHIVKTFYPDYRKIANNLQLEGY
jgi:DNA polymerase III delta prime subunit